MERIANVHVEKLPEGDTWPHRGKLHGCGLQVGRPRIKYGAGSADLSRAGGNPVTQTVAPGDPFGNSLHKFRTSFNTSLSKPRGLKMSLTSS